MAPRFPHLTDVESVRQEASKDMGVLSDAASIIRAHKASIDPNIEAAHLRKIDPEETKKVKQDLGLAQKKVDAAYPDDELRVIDAVVRGDALSTIVEDVNGGTHHLVVGWNDRWRSITPSVDEAAARANARGEAAKLSLGAEARAEIARQVEEQVAKITERVQKQLGGKIDETDKEVEKAIEDATKEAEKGEDAPTRTTTARKPRARKSSGARTAKAKS